MVIEEIVINQFFQSFATPLLTTFFQIITYLGHPSFWIIIAGIFYWKGNSKQSHLLVLLLIFSSIIAGILKIIIERPRPEGILVLESNTSFAMPSGHATLIASTTTFIHKTINTIQKNILYLAIVLVGISRIYLGAHYLTDVLAGLALGFFTAIVFLKIDKIIESKKIKTTNIMDALILLGLIAITLAAAKTNTQEYAVMFAFFGYFTGYILNKRIRNVNTKLSKRANIIGVTILVLLTIGAIFTNTPTSQVLYFTEGILITYIWPILATKLKI